MAIRQIRKNGDDILKKKSRIVERIDDRVLTLLDDMYETMTAANGVGIAAVQVGVLKRLAVIDTGEGPIYLINPKIVIAEGEREVSEGCLSVPGVYGIVMRPENVTVAALDREGKLQMYTAEEELLVKAFCHELDHLEGTLFLDKVIRFVEEDEE